MSFASEFESAFNWATGEADRIALFPIRHPDLWKYRKTLESLHWVAQEVDLSRDKADWEKRMTPDQRHFVKMQLAFFAQIDIDVLKNIDDNLCEEVDCLEARAVYAAQGDQEVVHAESYSLQIEAVLDGDERRDVLNAARTMPVVGRIREWVLRWFDRALPVGERLVAFVAVEGLMFSASFASLQWLKELNLLPGVTDFNTIIVRDEGLHTKFASALVRDYLRARPSAARVSAIFAEVVEILDEFVNESLPIALIGMSASRMREYVRFQADCVLLEMGYASVYRVRNPFEFMMKLTLNEISRVNFFEARPSQYQNVSCEGQALLKIDASVVEF